MRRCRSSPHRESGKRVAAKAHGRTPIGEYIRVLQHNPPQSDRLLRCRKMTLWANFCRTHSQQKQQAIAPSDRGAGATRLNNPANKLAP
jgi:hypothetical protein